MKKGVKYSKKGEKYSKKGENRVTIAKKAPQNISKETQKSIGENIGRNIGDVTKHKQVTSQNTCKINTENISDVTKHK